jgi:hypothetical protein
MSEKKQRRCLKATIYMYLPKKEDLDDPKKLRYYSMVQVGRVQLYDEYGEKTSGKMIAFDNYGQLIDGIAKQYKKLYKKIK